MLVKIVILSPFAGERTPLVNFHGSVHALHPNNTDLGEE